MPFSALPEHLQDIENNFPDDSQYGDSWFGKVYRWVNKKTKTWFAFSYRCTEWWARWRPTPLVLFARKGKGPWRYEYSSYTKEPYLSRIQYYCRWSLIIQWPLMICFHWYPKVGDVPYLGTRGDLDGKVWYGYWNHFDADSIYWMITSAYIGRNWK